MSDKRRCLTAKPNLSPTISLPRPLAAEQTSIEEKPPAQMTLPLPGRRPCAKVAANLLGLILLLPALCATAFAHDYWLDREGEQFALYQGHRYSAHKGEERVPYDPEIVKAVHCLLQNGALKELPRTNTYPLRLDGACVALFVQTSSGYWSQTLTGTTNKPRTEVPGTVRSWRSEEAIKYLNGWGPQLAAPMTQGLELVPLNNPLLQKPGDKIRLVAMWEGKARAGVTVAYDGNTRGVTADDGKINILVRHGGVQMLSASFEQPLQDAKADKILRSTILQYQLAE